MRVPGCQALRWCALALGLAIVAQPAAADEAVITNVEVMNKLATEIVGELIGSVPANVGMGDVILVPHATGEPYDFVEHVYTRVLTDGGHKVYASSASAPGAAPRGNQALRLEYWVLDFDLSYPKIYRPYLIGGKKVKRSADVKLLAKLLDPADDSVVWIGEASRSYKDGFSYKFLSEVETGIYAFAKPPQSTTKWGKLVEPVAVGGILIGLIYLFFSNQNDS